MHVSRVSFCGGNTVSVDGDAAQVGRCSAHLTEACFALVILHVDAGNAFQCVADVGVGELSDLVGTDHVRQVQVVFLCVDGSCLSAESSAHLSLSQFHRFAQCEILFQRGTGFNFQFDFQGGESDVVRLDGVGAGFQSLHDESSCFVADGFDVEGVNGEQRTGEIVSVFINDASFHVASLFGGRSGGSGRSCGNGLHRFCRSVFSVGVTFVCQTGLRCESTRG